MELPEELKKVLRETASSLRGYDRRQFMARTVRDVFGGVINRAVDTLYWQTKTLRKAMRELHAGIECFDATGWAGRPRAEHRIPDLLGDIRSLVDGQSQTDPRFETQRLYTRMTAAEVHRQLIAQKGYTDAMLPTEETIRVKLNDMGYRLRAVAKTKPKKRFPKRTRSSTR